MGSINTITTGFLFNMYKLIIFGILMLKNKDQFPVENLRYMHEEMCLTVVWLLWHVIGGLQSLRCYICQRGGVKLVVWLMSVI